MNRLVALGFDTGECIMHMDIIDGSGDFWHDSDIQFGLPDCYPTITLSQAQKWITSNFDVFIGVTIRAPYDFDMEFSYQGIVVHHHPKFHQNTS